MDGSAPVIEFGGAFLQRGFWLYGCAVARARPCALARSRGDGGLRRLNGADSGGSRRGGTDRPRLYEYDLRGAHYYCAGAER
jgi:hypothetical protein